MAVVCPLLPFEWMFYDQAEFKRQPDHCASISRQSTCPIYRSASGDNMNHILSYTFLFALATTTSSFFGGSSSVLQDHILLSVAYLLMFSCSSGMNVWLSRLVFETIWVLHCETRVLCFDSLIPGCGLITQTSTHVSPFWRMMTLLLGVWLRTIVVVGAWIGANAVLLVYVVRVIVAVIQGMCGRKK